MNDDSNAIAQLGAWLAKPNRRAWIELGGPFGAKVKIKVSGWRTTTELVGDEVSVGSYELKAEAGTFCRAWDLLSDQLASLGEP